MTTTVRGRAAHVQLDSGATRTDAGKWTGRAVAFCAALWFAQASVAQTEGTVTDSLRQSRRSGEGLKPDNILDVTAGAYETDNARRTRNDTVNDTVLSAGFDVNTARQGTRLNYDVAGNVNYLKYVDNTYKAEPYGVLDALATYAFFPERLDWRVQESFNRLLLDPTQSATLNNVESYNYFTTGPRYLLHFGRSASVLLQASYSHLDSINSSNISGAEVNLDSARYGAAASWRYAVSEHGKVSINVSQQNVRYSQKILHADYDRSEASIGYNTRIARTTIAVEVGDSRIKQHNQTASGLLARIGVIRRVSPASTLEAGFTRQTADAADIIRYDFGASASVSTAPLQIAARDPVMDTTGRLAWRFEQPRTRFGVDVYRTRERYTVSTTLNRDITGAYGYYERRLHPQWSLQLSARFEGQSFTGNLRSDNEFDLGAGLNWYAGRRLRVSFRGDRLNRRGGSFFYTENRIGVTLGYALLRPHA